MSSVVFLRGINVGGHRRFKPAALAAELQHLDAVNVGATGTFVIRKPIARARLRDEIERRLPFDVEITICSGREIARLVSQDFFEGHRARADVVRFVSVLAQRPRRAPQLPMTLRSGRTWIVKILARDNRFVIGLHRRQMKAISALGRLDRVFGVTATTRGWNTMSAIAKVLEGGAV